MAQGNASARRHQRDEGLGSLMARYLRGDDQAFRQLHACLQPQIKRQIRRKVADSGAVEDLLQQTFLKAHVARARFSSQPGRRSRRGELAKGPGRADAATNCAGSQGTNRDFPIKLDGQSQLAPAIVTHLDTRCSENPRSAGLSAGGPNNPTTKPQVERSSSEAADFTANFTDRSVAVWYSTIARNATVDYLRKRGRDKTVCWDDPNDEQRGEPALRDPKAEFEGRAVREEERAQLKHDVRNAVDQLPPLQREVVELHRFDGLSIAEISQRTQVHEGTLRVRAHRAYRSLANRLARPEADED